MDEAKAKAGFWITEWMWNLYLIRRESLTPAVRRGGQVFKAKALIICDRVLTNREIHNGSH